MLHEKYVLNLADFITDAGGPQKRCRYPANSTFLTIGIVN